MNGGAPGGVRRAIEAALCFLLGPGDRESARETAPSRTPVRGTRRVMDAPPDPIAGEDFHALRTLREAFALLGLPQQSERTATDEARIATFFVLQELLHLLGQFRRAVEQGELPRLVVSEHGRQLGKVVIEIRIEGRR